MKPNLSVLLAAILSVIAASAIELVSTTKASADFFLYDSDNADFVLQESANVITTFDNTTGPSVIHPGEVWGISFTVTFAPPLPGFFIAPLDNISIDFQEGLGPLLSSLQF